MYITSVKMKSFRNLEKFQVSFCKNRNLIHGKNGAGKTSILEAIFILAFGKSFLNRKKSEMVKHQFGEFYIETEITDPQNQGSVTISAHYKDRFSIHLNQKKTTLFEINNYLYPVFFSSADYNLSIENKPHTRKMMDRFIFGVDTLYIKYLLSYNKALKQKNFLLKTERDLYELRSWNKLISELAVKLVGIKMKFVDKLNKEIQDKFDRPLNIVYTPSFDISEEVSETAFFNRLESVSRSEVNAGRALVGPHLDTFQLNLDGRNLRTYSSGQKKINLLMAYIAFIELFEKKRREYPVFLVDDYDTAIDKENIAFLMDNYPQMQVIATSVNNNGKFDQQVELSH